MIRARIQNPTSPRRLVGRRAVVCLRLLFLISFSASTSLAQYRFDQWTADNGLPQNSIHAIQQTRDGYLWLATSDGLARFDGVRFTVFNKSNSPGLDSNRFNSLYEAPDGALWAGTESGGVTRYSRGIFTTYTTEHGLPHNAVGGVIGDETGRLWALAQNQLSQWQESAGRFSPVIPQLPLFNISAPSFSSFNGFWGTDQTSLYRFAGGRLEVWSRAAGLPSLDIHAVAADRHGAIWVATRDAGLAQIKDGKVVKVYDQRTGLPGNLLWFIAGAELKIACADGQRRLHFINLDSQSNTQPNTLTAQAVWQPPPGLLEQMDIEQPYLDITALYEDREGNLWLGTQRRGLYRVRRQLITTYSKQHGLVDNNVYPIYEDRAGAVWIGAWYRGLSRYEGGRFTNYTKQDGLASDLVTAIGEDREGRLWVAAYGDAEHSGLRVFENGRFTAFKGIAKLVGQVSAIFPDRTGALWFGSDLGLAHYQHGAVTTLTKKDGLAGDEVKVIIEGAAGQLWIGSLGGLSRYQNGQLTNWTERDGLPSNHVRALYEDREGVLWIGTYDGGLGRFHEGRFTRYTTREGLFNDGVFRILEDARGYFWMSCNRGLYRVSKQELNDFAAGKSRTITSIAYGRSDGLLNPECNGGRWPAGVKTRDGRLWFPTQDGVAVVDPEAIPLNAQPPPVLIEVVRVEREPVDLGGNATIQIAPGQDDLEIEYTALSFINSEHLRFKYKLEGLNEDWIDAGTRRTAYFSRVPPGSYTFKVIAANSDGVWNTEGQSLRITVLPPFYRTWWFLTLAGLLVGGAILATFRYRVAQLERRQAAQQAFARQLLESQEHERQRIAAELHDSLGQNLLVIKNRAMLNALTLPEEQARTQFTEISDAVAQTLEEVRAISHDLRPPHLDQLGLRTALVAMIEKVAASSPIQFTYELDECDGRFAPGDDITIYRIVQECLNNILKHSGATEAQVWLRVDAWQARLTIRDNGRGFTSEGDAQVGLGLQGIAERARILGGTHTIQSAPGQGTTVVVRVELKDK